MNRQIKIKVDNAIKAATANQRKERNKNDKDAKDFRSLVYKRFNTLERRVDEFERQIGSLQSACSRIPVDYDTVQGSIKELKQKIKQLEATPLPQSPPPQPVRKRHRSVFSAPPPPQPQTVEEFAEPSPPCPVTRRPVRRPLTPMPSHTLTRTVTRYQQPRQHFSHVARESVPYDPFYPGLTPTHYLR